MAMTMQQRKAAQRSRPEGYAKSREADWKAQGIVDASYIKYLETIIQQGCKCAICGTRIDNRSPYDHDHRTGKARSVLCTDCNLSLGHVEAQRRFLDGAADYLHQWEAA